MAEQVAKVEGLNSKVAEHEIKINNQKVEIDQLEKKNSELTGEKNHQLVLAASIRKVM